MRPQPGAYSSEEERNQIALQTQRESLQANLLRAVSHDLRTPLTNINGSVGILMGKDQTLKPEVREQLYTAIDDDTNWLINMTENLLAATQLETDRTKLKTAPELLEDLFQSAVRQLDRRARDHHISVDLEDQTLMASMNAGDDSEGHHQHDEQCDPIYAQGLPYHS